MLKFLLEELEKNLGIKTTKGSGERNLYFLVSIPPHDEVWIKELDSGLVMETSIGLLPTKTSNEDLLGYLMRANFLGQGTGGGILSLDPNEKFLTLLLKIPYEINYASFKDELENFVNYASYWREKVKEYEGTGQV